MYQSILSFLIVLVSVIQINAQISGVVLDKETNEPLFGAAVATSDNTGTTTGLDGEFTLDIPSGEKLTITYLGYESTEVLAEDGMVVKLLLSSNVLEEIVVSSGVIDIAKIRETPFALSTIAPSEITLKTGNLEFPEIMNRTPGVYATKQGGGYGDSRISLRGFDQRNTAFLINGQPVNDMENGWVYWSNWQGLTDVASGIQIQRGLGSTRLAVPSVGGTVSIFTKSAEKMKGGSLSQTIGNDGFTKTTLNYNTGVNDRGWAYSFLATKWAGDGYVYNTRGEGWTYFGAVGYEPVGSSHKLNLSVLGAGQWHHQRDAWVSIRDYEYFGEEGIDQRWNSNGGTLNGEEYSMRRNFYNKPLATFNWDWEISPIVKLSTSLYASAGRGGGTGPRGNNFRNGDIDILPYRKDLYEHWVENGRGPRNQDGTIDFDRVVSVNRSTTDPYTGGIGSFAGSLIGSNGFREDGVNRSTLIRRASMNSHDWVGAISNLEIDANDFKISVGVDLRNYKGYHYRVLNDLLGLDGYYSTGNKNSLGQIIETTTPASPFQNTGIKGPKIDYYNIGYVGWRGLNSLVEYSGIENFTAVLQGGLSVQTYQREDLFDQPGMPLSDKESVGGGYLKGGANYNIDEKSNVFVNAGFISRQPNFDAVFPNFANVVNPDLQNERITSIELGYGFVSSKFTANINAYNTIWGNRFISRGITNLQGVDGVAQFRNIDVRHSGIELETTYRPTNSLKLNGMVSIGDWRYTKDFETALFDDSQNQIGTGTLYTKGAKVGDAAQFTTFLGLDYKLGPLNLDLGYRFVDGLYADYSITDSDFLTPDNQGALKLPSYGLVDLGTTLRFGLLGSMTTLRLNVNNLFDTTYIAESNSNIHATPTSQTWNGVDTRNYVWFGFGRTWNLSLKFQI